MIEQPRIAGKERHKLLPAHLSASELADWLRASAVDRFTDPRKRNFSKDEIQEFEHESSVKGREINRLKDILKDVTTHVNKGSDEPMTIIVPATDGVKLLDEARRQNDDFIETGVEQEDVEIYGIPNPDNHMMEFFDHEGNWIADRQRALSSKEKHLFLGMFKTMKIDESTGRTFDSETGEELDGTNG